jgi:hypothetical protein
MKIERTVHGTICQRFFDRMFWAGYWDALDDKTKDRGRAAMLATLDVVFPSGGKWFEMVQQCCDAMGMSYEVACGIGRSQSQARARRAIAYVLRKSSPQPSWTEIATAMGRHHHTTPYNAYLACIEALQSGDELQAETVSTCMLAIQQPQECAA